MVANVKISILVPIYNVAPYIEPCLRSLFEQTYPNIEYIFVNDCTQDNSMEILERILTEYPQRKEQVKIFHHQINRGLAAARNTAIDNANGEYVMIVDSDDYMTLNAVEVMYNAALQTQSDIVIGQMLAVIKGRIESRKFSTDSTPTPINNKDIPYLRLSLWGKIYKRELFTDIRLVEGIDFGEDAAFTPKLYYYAKKIIVINKVVYYYIKRTTSYTGNISNKVDEYELALDCVCDFYKNVNNLELYEAWMGKLLLCRLGYIKNAFPSYKTMIKATNLCAQADVAMHTRPFRERIFLQVGAKKWYLLMYIMIAAQRLLVKCRRLIGCAKCLTLFII